MGDKENIEEFEYDYDAVLRKPRSMTGTTEYIPQDPKYHIPDDIPIRERWRLHQELGQKQAEAGVAIPVKKHRCDDYLEDIFVSVFTPGERNLIFPATSKFFSCFLSKEGEEPKRVRDTVYYTCNK